MFFLVMDNNLWTKKNHIKKFKGRSDGWFVDYSATLKLFLESVFKNKTNWVRRQLFNGEETFSSLWYPDYWSVCYLQSSFFCNSMAHGYWYVKFFDFINTGPGSLYKDMLHQRTYRKCSLTHKMAADLKSGFLCSFVFKCACNSNYQ